MATSDHHHAAPSLQTLAPTAGVGRRAVLFSILVSVRVITVLIVASMVALTIASFWRELAWYVRSPFGDHDVAVTYGVRVNCGSVAVQRSTERNFGTWPVVMTGISTFPLPPNRHWPVFFGFDPWNRTDVVAGFGAYTERIDIQQLGLIQPNPAYVSWFLQSHGIQLPLLVVDVISAFLCWLIYQWARRKQHLLRTGFPVTPPTETPSPLPHP